MVNTTHVICVICYDDYTPEETNRDEDKILVTLHCGHSYHQGCIDHWLERSRTCPCCRTRVEARPARLWNNVLQRYTLVQLPLDPLSYVSGSDMDDADEESQGTMIDEEFEATFAQIMRDRQRDERINNLRDLEMRVIRNMARLREVYDEEQRILDILRAVVHTS